MTKTKKSFENLNLFRRLTAEKVKKESFTVRLPTDSLQIIEAIAEKLDQKRTDVAVSILEGGCRDVAQALGISLKDDGSL